jgi:gamma-D-glutamyl-L-lysine dipeptidyl-peptidase
MTASTGNGAAAAAVAQLIEDTRRRFVPDPRRGVFDVTAEPVGAGYALRGQATHDEAVTTLLAAVRSHGSTVVDEVVRLPDPSFGEARHALVRSAVAPVYATPHLPASQITELVLGMRVELLSRQDAWIRLRSEDGYVGWTHAGYIQPGTDDWAFGWERGSTGEPVVSLGAELVDEDGRVVARLPWGARIVRHTGAYHVPSGASGSIDNGEVVDVDRLADRFPARGESITRTARRWMGAPYLWGGITLHGVDCSGFSQAVMWMHGIALPRDSDLQATSSVGVAIDTNPDGLRAGDLVFFAETGQRITHVAISLGGPHIIHSALTNGGVAVNDLSGDEPFEARLRSVLVAARRLLAD